MPRRGTVADGQQFEIRRRGGTDSEVVSPGGALLFLLRRPCDKRDWLFTLWKGDLLFDAQDAKLQPLVTLVRIQKESLIRLQAPDRVLTDVVRIDTHQGYVGSDPRHRFAWEGKKYLLSAKTHSHVFGGRDVHCIDEQTGELVMHFATKNFSKEVAGFLTVSQKFAETSLIVMVAAMFAFHEFDERMKQLIFGDQYFNRDVTG